MHNFRFRPPKKSIIYLALAVVCAVLLFANIFWTEGMTGEKEIWEFGRMDWLYFAVFLLSEAVIVLLMLLFGLRGGRAMKERWQLAEEYYAQFRYCGIDVQAYDHVWFDFSGHERALILKRDGGFLLRVERFDRKLEKWKPVGEESCFDSLEAVREELYFEYGFFCEENARLDADSGEGSVGEQEKAY